MTEGVCASDGWIDLKGKFYPCAPLSHMYAAEELCAILGIGERGAFERALETFGAVKISGGKVYAERPINKQQESCIVDVAAAYDKIDEPHMAAAIMKDLAHITRGY